MTTALARRVDNETLRIIAQIAPNGIALGKRPEQSFIILLAAHELGLPLVASLSGLIYVVNGQAALSARAVNALIQRSGILGKFEIKDHVDKGEPSGCTVTMRRADNGFEYTYSFMRKDAERAQLLTKTNWQCWPGEMYRSRAISSCGRVVAPDVLCGLYTIEELGVETGEDGEPIAIEGQFTVSPPIVAQPTVESMAAEITAQFGAEAVMAECGGNMPDTIEGWQAIGAALAVKQIEKEQQNETK